MLLPVKFGQVVCGLFALGVIREAVFDKFLITFKMFFYLSLVRFFLNCVLCVLFRLFLCLFVPPPPTIGGGRHCVNRSSV